MNGRKRFGLVDTMGLLVKQDVLSAAVQDRDGGRGPVEEARRDHPSVSHLWADSAFAGEFEKWVGDGIGWTIEVVSKLAGQSTFQVLPRRWVVERTYGWLGRYRRLSKDYEENTESSKAWIYLAMICLMARRLAINKR